jgi:lipopolysaccharide export system permease protein
MPILWRYLLSNYIKVLSLSVVSFLAILLTTRLNEIAHFAALGAQGLYVFWFALYQIPYILPIVLPISCLISTMLLVQRLSATHELTALRASGLAIKDILSPLLLAASLLSLFNFYIVSEVATHSHLKTRVLEQELRSLNPLLLLENNQFMKIKGLYINNMGKTRQSESASDIVIAFSNNKNHRLSLMLSKVIQNNASTLLAKNVTLMNSMAAHQRELFDHLILENIKLTSTPIQDFSQTLRKQGSRRIHTDYLKLSLLLMRAQEDFMGWHQKKESALHSNDFYKRRTFCCLSEILRRISLSIAVLTFTLMGLSFGISISRKQTYRNIFWTLCLAILFLVSYFLAKGLDHFLFLTAPLYILPHVIIVSVSIWSIKRISKGIE